MPSMLLDQQDVALGQESLPELSPRCADADGKDPDVVFPPSLRRGRPVVCHRLALRGTVGGSGGGAGFTALGAWALIRRRCPFLCLTIARLSAGPVCLVRPVTARARVRAEAGGCFGLGLRGKLCMVAGGFVSSACRGRWGRGRLGGRGVRGLVMGS